MLFFNFKSKALVVISLIFVGSAFAEEAILTENDLLLLKRSGKIMAESRKLNSPDWLRTYDPSSSVQQNADGVSRWIPAADKINKESNDFVKMAIKKVYGIHSNEQIITIDTNPRENSPLNKGEELYFFISF